MATITQYMAWVQKRMGGLIVREGLHYGLLKVVQGPLTITYQLVPKTPSPQQVKKLLGMGPAFQAAFQVDTVRIAQRQGRIDIEIPSPRPRTPSGQDLARCSRGFAVCVGVDSLRKPVHVDLQQHGALMWVGPSRRGKTQSMKCTLYALARQVQSGARLRYVILSQKQADWRAFQPAAGCMGIVGDKSEAQDVMTWAVETLHSAAQNGLDHNLIIVCDDLLNLLKQAPGIADGLAEIASMGAGLGVHLLVGTQTAGSKQGTGGAGVEANVTARINYKSATAAGAARDAGRGGVGLDQLSDHKGDALLTVDGQSQRIATGLADDADIAQLGAGDLVVAPWLSTGCAQPAHNRSQPVDNRLQPPQPPETHPPREAHAATADGGDAQPVVAVADELFPIDKREPTADERDTIRQLHADGESLSALCRRVYGFKDGATFGWIKTAVNDEPDAPEDEPTGNPSGQAGPDADTIDLTTEAGREQWHAIMGDVNWNATSDINADRRLLS